MKRKKKIFGTLLSAATSIISAMGQKDAQDMAIYNEKRKQEKEKALNDALEKRQNELDYYMQQNTQDNSIYDEKRAEIYKSGGSIHIAPSKRGTFTAAATKHGMNVQEFANEVLGNKDNYSPTMIKKATFAHNFAKKCGGKRVIKGKKNMYLS